MDYDALITGEITAGNPTKEEIFTKVKHNQDQFNTDIAALQQTATFDVFDIKFQGALSEYSVAEYIQRAPTFKAPVSGRLVNFVVTLLEVSTSGTLQVDIDKSTDNGINWTPLLTSPVEVTTQAIGDVSGAVNWADVPSQSFVQGNLLRVRVSGLQVDQGAFHVSIYGELS